MKRPVRILHLITRLDRGGAEHHVLQLCRGLSRRGAGVTAAYLKGPGELEGAFRRAGCRVVRTGLDPILPTNPLRALRELTGIIRALRPDVVHTHMPKAETFGNPAARAARVPAVFSTKHNDDPRLRAPLGRAAHVAASALCDAVIVPTEYMARFTRSVGCCAPLATIPYGLDIERFRGSADPSKTQLRRREFGDRVIGTVARLVPQKGLLDLAQAATGLDARVVVVGDGPLKPRLEAAGLRVLPRTADVASVLGAFDLFCLPSRWEGFGMVLLEAMSLGVPIVATRASSIPEVVGDAAVLVPPGDPAALRGALRELLADPARMRALGEAGRARVESRFGIDRMIDSTLKLYREGPPVTALPGG